jgi:hypothetical protein
MLFYTNYGNSFEMFGVVFETSLYPFYSINNGFDQTVNVIELASQTK